MCALTVAVTHPESIVQGQPDAVGGKNLHVLWTIAVPLVILQCVVLVPPCFLDSENAVD